MTGPCIGYTSSSTVYEVVVLLLMDYVRHGLKKDQIEGMYFTKSDLVNRVVLKCVFFCQGLKVCKSKG